MYFLILCIVFFAAIGSNYSMNVNIKRKRGMVSTSEIVLAIASMLILFTVAFRNSTIGTDTAQYINRYNIVRNTNWLDVIFMRGRSASSEPLFIYLNKVLSCFAGKFGHIIIIAEAFFLYFGYLKVIKKYSTNAFVSLICFLGFGVYLISLCLLRQTLAICICTFAIKYIFEKNPVKFYIVVGLACLVHFSAIFFLIAYFAANQLKCSRMNTLLILGGGIVVSTMLNVLQRWMSTIFPRWFHYANVERHAGGYIAFSIFLFFTLLILFERKQIMRMSSYAPALINMNTIHMAIWCMRLVSRNAERISFYYVIAPILLIPYLLKAISDRVGYKYGLLFKAAILLLLSAYFVNKFIDDKSLYPYLFMWGKLL